MPFNCILIGQDSMLIECAENLLKVGHHIKWVVSNFPLIHAWCLKHKVAYVESIDQLLGDENNQVDYLFSIVNEKILTSEALSLARISAFNYHDALLPQYAGVHATSWALLNGETMHGITWHVVNEGIDEGDIVYQSPIPILENETALTLNLRCFEEAIKGFSILIRELETASLTRQKQCLTKRSYYGKYAVLPNLGFINWLSDAALIKRTCLALNFGNYDNALGTLKLYLGFSYLIVLTVEIAPTTVENKPAGVILALGEDGLVVTTASQPIVIKKMITTQGQPVSPLQLAEQYGLSVDSQLPQIVLPAATEPRPSGSSAVLATSNARDSDCEMETEIQPLYVKALKQEKYWLKKLQNIVEHSSYTERFWDRQGNYQKLELVGRKTKSEKKEYFRFILNSLLVYLLRINNYEPYTVFLSQGQSNRFPLFSDYLPMTIDWESTWDFNQVLQEIDKFLAEFKQESYLTDIYCRHPSLEQKQLITIRLANSPAPVPENSMLHFEIHKDLAELTLYYRLDLQAQGGLLKPLIENMQQHFAKVLDALHASSNGLIHAFSLISEQEKRQLFEWGVGESIAFPRRVYYG